MSRSASDLLLLLLIPVALGCSAESVTDKSAHGPDAVDDAAPGDSGDACSAFLA